MTAAGTGGAGTVSKVAGNGEENTVAHLVVAVVAPGNMGAAVAKRLIEHSVEVLTLVEGRSAMTSARAASAGMRAVTPADLVRAQLVLSIVPPAAALPFAELLSPALRAAPCKPVFVDCNAVSPATAQRIAAVIEPTGAPFVDAGIIGPPPQAHGPQPSIYASGPHATRLSLLAARGLDIRVLAGPIGAASALKMSFAGISKGILAVATAMTLAATRAGAAPELRRALAEREPTLLAALDRKIPDMLQKAYRWVAEMQEIAQFATPQAGGDLYEAAARLYDRVARAMAEDGFEVASLRHFFER
jgi:L-threonate 2-dehydrogenase